MKAPRFHRAPLILETGALDRFVDTVSSAGSASARFISSNICFTFLRYIGDFIGEAGAKSFQ